MFVIIWLLLTELTQNSSGGKKGLSPEIMIKEATYEVKLNETICLPCKCKKQYQDQHDHRRCLFYWTKNDTILLEDRVKYRLKHNKCLEIKKIRSADHARYVCHAKSHFGVSRAVRNLIVVNRDMDNLQKTEERITVQNRNAALPGSPFPVPPFLKEERILKRSAKLLYKHFFIGKRAKLKCAVNGSPRPNVKWFHNGRSLEGDAKFRIRKRNFALIIDKFSKEQVGNYTCVASNGNDNTSMSFIVAVKAGDPNPPPATELEKIVSEGDNITLRCKKPIKKVKYLLWDIPKRIRRTRDKFRYRGRDPSKSSKSEAESGSVIKVLHLYNITAAKHGGDYRCLAVYKRSQKPIPVKIIRLKVKAGSQMSLLPGSSPRNEILLVKIAVPVMGSFVTLFIVIICFRCRRKTSHNVPTKGSKVDDDDDTLSMQILPTIPMGTLRIHKSCEEYTCCDSPESCAAPNSNYLKKRSEHSCRSNCSDTEGKPLRCELDEPVRVQSQSHDTLSSDKQLLDFAKVRNAQSEKGISLESLAASFCNGNVRTLKSPVFTDMDGIIQQQEWKKWEPSVRASKLCDTEKSKLNKKLIRPHSDCPEKAVSDTLLRSHSLRFIT